MAKIDGKDLATKIAKIEKPTSMQKWIESRKDVIQKALPKGYDVDRMIRIVIGALRNNPNLVKCTPISFISAVMQSIQLGLEPNTVLGHAYIIPYWNSKLKCYEAQFQRGYRGLLDMAYRTGQFTEIYAKEVCKGDEFDYMLGTERWVKHRIGKREYDKNGNPIVEYVYAEYKTIKGGSHLVVWTKEMLDRHKERYSPAAKQDKFSAWNVSEISMYKKTVLKDLLNYADISIEFRKQLQTDEVVKREIKPNMIDTVKPVYEFNPDDLEGMEEIDMNSKADKKETKKEKKLKKGDKLVTDKQIKRYYALVKEAGLDIDKVDERIKKKYNVEHKNELTMEQMDEIYKRLEERIEEKVAEEREANKENEDFNRDELIR